MATTCEVGAEFNLINLAYIVSGPQALLTVDLTDNGKLLYSQFIGFEGERAFQYYYVKPVPLPAAAWLFGSGVLGLIGIARRKKFEMAPRDGFDRTSLSTAVNDVPRISSVRPGDFRSLEPPAGTDDGSG